MLLNNVINIDVSMTQHGTIFSGQQCTLELRSFCWDWIFVVELTWFLFQDYPSVSQISSKIREKSINMIFAVTEDQLSVYEKLSQYIEGSEATKLANDSSNIVQVIRNNYKVNIICIRMVHLVPIQC